MAAKAAAALVAERKAAIKAGEPQKMAKLFRPQEKRGEPPGEPLAKQQTMAENDDTPMDTPPNYTKDTPGTAIITAETKTTEAVDTDDTQIKDSPIPEEKTNKKDEKQTKIIQQPQRK